MQRYTVVETRFGYNVQIMTQGVVIANSTDGVLAIAQRLAENEAMTKGVDASKIKKDFISLI